MPWWAAPASSPTPSPPSSSTNLPGTPSGPRTRLRGPTQPWLSPPCTTLHRRPPAPPSRFQENKQLAPLQRPSDVRGGTTIWPRNAQQRRRAQRKVLPGKQQQQKERRKKVIGAEILSIGKQECRDRDEGDEAGKLKSGRSGKKVTNPKQAIAIGLSKARKEGKKVPAKKS